MEMNFERYATSDETICSSDCKDMKLFRNFISWKSEMKELLKSIEI